MENKKDIGKAFRERLDLLEKSPDAALWNKIEKDLHKKNKKKYFLWLFLAGCFTLTTLFILYNHSNGDHADPSNYGAYSNKNNTAVEKDKTSSDSGKNLSSKTEESKADGNTSFNNKADVQSSELKKTFKDTFDVANNQPANQSDPNKKENKQRLVTRTKRLVNSNSQYDEFEIVEKYRIKVKHPAKGTPASKNKLQITNSNQKAKTRYIAAKSNKKRKNKQNTTHKTHKQNIKIANSKAKQDNLGDLAIKDTDLNVDVSKNNETSGENDEITKANALPIDTKKDSVLKQKLKAKKEVAKKTEEQKNKQDSIKTNFYVFGYYGPTVSGSLFGKSLINDSFDQNKKKHPITSSYGFYLGVKRDRLGVRLGFGKIELENQTKITNYPNGPISNYSNIELHTGTTPQTLSNHFSSSESLMLKQNVTYYEVPLEFTYTLFSRKKFDIDALAGINIILLDKNNIRISGNQAQEISIGRTENLAETNFALNIGSGFNYHLTPKIQANISPVLKYFYNLGNENYKPYSFSLQTGLTYKF
ncbi:hypothetical protein LZZ90_04135 [Flavobacterium sp. SM15]|uniref:hypothetical protein n=1 Tax=Flavobacterium sp. SM15 TaxID=2908005 RepID=UPI001EDA355E|nr:hypothetical protein [Flavobacterium sp. SM15]MCG2610691.1 hypothetical protein [Flavobacterium sp. SM15]